MSDGVLKISSVRKEDEGEYVCIARNSEGSSSGRLPILVRGNYLENPSFISLDCNSDF